MARFPGARDAVHGHPALSRRPLLLRGECARRVSARHPELQVVRNPLRARRVLELLPQQPPDRSIGRHHFDHHRHPVRDGPVAAAGAQRDPDDRGALLSNHAAGPGRGRGTALLLLHPRTAPQCQDSDRQPPRDHPALCHPGHLRAHGELRLRDRGKRARPGGVPAARVLHRNPSHRALNHNRCGVHRHGDFARRVHHHLLHNRRRQHLADLRVGHAADLRRPADQRDRHHPDLAHGRIDGDRAQAEPLPRLSACRCRPRIFSPLVVSSQSSAPT